MSDGIRKTVKDLIDQADEVFSDDARRNESRLLYEKALSRARAAGMFAMEEYVRGKIELIGERWKEAAEHFQKVLELERDFSKAWQYKGFAMDEMGEYEEAVEYYSKAIEINPKDEDAWNNKGLSLYEMERYEEALECYNRALEINPKIEDAWNNKGLSLYEMERYEEALECYNRALEINPKIEDAWFNKGLCLGEMERYEEALRCYNRVLEINPEDEDAWFNKGNSLYEMERYEEALRCYNRALEINPEDEDAWFNKGNSLYEMERYEEALRCYNRALEINPKNEDAWNNKGNSLYEMERYEEALRCYKRALEINPKNEDAWNNKGLSLYKMEEYQEALECHKKALEINPKIEDAWNNKGLSLYKMEEYQEALECHKKALEINPKNEDAWIYKGNSLDELEENERALECYDKALELNSANIETWINKGNILYKMGRHEEALECYDRALEINPKDENAWFNKGLSLDEVERYKEALECYKRAIEINPKNLIFRTNRKLAQKHLEILEKEEEDREEKSLAVDLRREVLNELEDKYGEILKSKELTQEKLDTFLRPRNNLLSDNFLLVLRRWNSYTPTMHTITKSNPGGGYFLYWKGKGIVIDPGFDFLDNFLKNDLYIQDIDAVIITHSHVDHCNDFESILTLVYEYNDKNKDKDKGGKKEIDVFMNLGAMKKFLSWIPMEPGEKSLINRVYSLEYGNSYDLKDYGLTLRVTRAIHDEVLGKSYSVGLIFELHGKEKHKKDNPLRIGYTSDTGHDESVEEQYRGVDIIIAHLGSIEKADFDFEEKEESGNHLMLTGVISTIEKSKAKLALISEFGEELGEDRITIVDALDSVFRNKGKTRCLAGDIGLRILIPELKIKCKYCREYKDMNQILERIDAQDKKSNGIVYFCDHCMNTYNYLKEDSTRLVIENDKPNHS